MSKALQVREQARERVAKNSARLIAAGTAAHRPKRTAGPHSRQPLLELPRIMPNGPHTSSHPLLWLLARHLERYPDTNKSDIARRMEVDVHALYKWERACRDDRNFPLPVLRAKQLADIFKVSPATFRPDFPWGKQS